jgi:hypothetical protein
MNWPHLFWKIFVDFLTSTLLRTQNTTLLLKVRRRFFSNFVAFSENPNFKGGFKSEEAGDFFRCQNRYSKSLSWAENLNFPPKTVNNLFKFSTQDSDLEYSFWQWKNSWVSSDLKPPLTEPSNIRHSTFLENKTFKNMYH